MLWSRSQRRQVAGARRDLQAKFAGFPAPAAVAADAKGRARDVSSAAIDQLLASIDNLGAALAAMSEEAGSLAKAEADSIVDQIVAELKRHPVRSLAIAVGIGAAAGLFARR